MKAGKPANSGLENMFGAYAQQFSLVAANPAAAHGLAKTDLRIKVDFNLVPLSLTKGL